MLAIKLTKNVGYRRLTMFVLAINRISMFTFQLSHLMHLPQSVHLLTTLSNSSRLADDVLFKSLASQLATVSNLIRDLPVYLA